MNLSTDDRAAIRRVDEVVDSARIALAELERRNGLDITGPALAALTSKPVSFEFVPRPLSRAERMDRARRHALAQTD